MPDESQAPLITPDDFHRVVHDRRWFGEWLGLEVKALRRGGATIELAVRDELLREGGTVAGPIVMAVADIALYAAVIATYEEGRKAVTADMTMHFLRRPAGARLKAEATIIKAGRRLTTGRVEVFMDDDERPVAHIVSSYALP